jgi:hypothetical protein
MYCLQDALNDAEDIKSVESERNGIKFYDYEIASPVRHMCHCYLGTFHMCALLTRPSIDVWRMLDAWNVNLQQACRAVLPCLMALLAAVRLAQNRIVGQ